MISNSFENDDVIDIQEHFSRIITSKRSMLKVQLKKKSTKFSAFKQVLFSLECAKEKSAK